MVKWFRMKAHSTLSVAFNSELDLLKAKVTVSSQPSPSCISAVMCSSSTRSITVPATAAEDALCAQFFAWVLSFFLILK